MVSWVPLTTLLHVIITGEEEELAGAFTAMRPERSFFFPHPSPLFSFSSSTLPVPFSTSSPLQTTPLNPTLISSGSLIEEQRSLSLLRQSTTDDGEGLAIGTCFSIIEASSH